MQHDQKVFMVSKDSTNFAENCSVARISTTQISTENCLSLLPPEIAHNVIVGQKKVEEQQSRKTVFFRKFDYKRSRRMDRRDQNSEKN